jgi:conjugal transfer pilus assembly protein TraB
MSTTEFALKPTTRRWLLVSGSLLILFGCFYWYFAASDTSSTKTSVSAKNAATTGGTATNVNSALNASGVTAATKAIMAPGSQVDPAKEWIATAGKDIATLSDRAEKADQVIAKQDQTLKVQNELIDAIKKQMAASNAQVSPVNPLSQGNAPSTATVPPVAPVARFPSPDALPRRGVTLPGNAVPPAPVGAYPAGGRLEPDASAPGSRLVRLSALRESSGSEGNTAPPTASIAPTAPATVAPNTKRKTVDNYLPVSFTPALLLGGLDAPTGGQSQTNPHPVLMRLESNAILPNRFRAGIKECLVVGGGYGDISSERCYIRTERLSCVRQDGGIVETPLKGSVFGEDGKIGMRGRLVEKQGQVLANAFLAAGVGGIGQALQSRASVVSTTALGSTSTVASGREFEAAIGTGVGRAMDRLAQYYISLAEKVFPIIECDAGRKIDVVITEGIRLDEELSGVASGSAAVAATASSLATSLRSRAVEDTGGPQP